MGNLNANPFLMKIFFGKAKPHLFFGPHLEYSEINSNNTEQHKA